MTPKQIQYFEAVCKNQSMTKAAEECFISRPVISRALIGLEKELGLTLFERTENNRLILTESGSACRTFFREYKNAFDTMLDRLHTVDWGSSSRLLRVGITPAIGKRFYPDFFAGFKKLHGDAQLAILEVPALESLEAVISGEIDLFFSPAELNRATVLESLWLYDSEFVFCVPKNSEYAQMKLVHMNMIDALPMATLLAPFPPRVQLSNVIITTSQQDLVHSSVAAGDAFAVLPLDVVCEWADITTVPLEPRMRYSVNMIWNKALPHDNVFEDLLSFAGEYFRESEN